MSAEKQEESPSDMLHEVINNIVEDVKKFLELLEAFAKEKAMAQSPTPPSGRK